MMTEGTSLPAPDDPPAMSWPPVAGSEPDVQDPSVVSQLFDQAAEANIQGPSRSGSVVNLPAQGTVLMTGDLHDHTLNYQRAVKLAALDDAESRYIILHEVVHGPVLVNGCDLSVRLLARVAALKLRYPQQVLILQANHELAQLTGGGIFKGGTNVVDAFDAGLGFIYQQQEADVRRAMNRFIRSLLLGVRCSNGVFCCHSLPSPGRLKSFDRTVLDRVPTDGDLAAGGSVHRMVWGRNHTQEVADELGEPWGARVFVMGHQPVEMGYDTEGDSMLILNSDHEHGVALPIDLGRCDDRNALVERIVPLASVAL